ncbi:MAG: NUDIX hydrolase [Candidatus Binatia bacterium]
MGHEPATAHPAATVVIVRDRRDDCEVLLVRRNARLSFHGGAWVFPGGRVDAADYGGGDDVVAAARQAAVREAREETGLELRGCDLVAISRWVTPVQLPKRFDTWFFAAEGTDAPVAVDGGEIHDHQWMSPAEALTAQRAGAIELPPPTFVTITAIAPHRTARSALTALGRDPQVFEPRLFPLAGGAVTLYAGDAGYEDAELERPGRRHRLWMLEDGWRYERE